MFVDVVEIGSWMTELGCAQAEALKRRHLVWLCMRWFERSQIAGSCSAGNQSLAVDILGLADDNLN